MTDQRVLERVWAEIREDELTEFALHLGNTPAPAGYEAPLAEAVAAWMNENGIPARTQEVFTGRLNALGVVRGTSGRAALLFNSHLDSDVGAPEDVHAVEPARDYQQAWTEGDRIYGKTVLNDRGPMAAWLFAARACLRAGVQLRHDLVLTAGIGEIGMAPVDEFQGGQYVGKGIGARHLVTHGAVADFAFVGETTDFCPVWAECGVAYYKVTVHGESIYVPRVEVPADRSRHPNAIVRARYLIDAIEDWAAVYKRQQARTYGGGDIIPKIGIAAIRGGSPPKPHTVSGICHLYIDVLLPPGADPQGPTQHLRRLIADLGYEGSVECFLYRRGYIAEGIEPLLDSLRRCHELVFGTPAGVAPADVNSMWRDINVFNEVGIPALNYGPPRRQDQGQKFAHKYFLKSDLVNAARVYTGVILDRCEVEG